MCGVCVGVSVVCVSVCVGVCGVCVWCVWCVCECVCECVCGVCVCECVFVVRACVSSLIRGDNNPVQLKSIDRQKLD